MGFPFISVLLFGQWLISCSEMVLSLPETETSTATPSIETQESSYFGIWREYSTMRYLKLYQNKTGMRSLNLLYTCWFNYSCYGEHFAQTTQYRACRSRLKNERLPYGNFFFPKQTDVIYVSRGHYTINAAENAFYKFQTSWWNKSIFWEIPCWWGWPRITMTMTQKCVSAQSVWITVSANLSVTIWDRVLATRISCENEENYGTWLSPHMKHVSARVLYWLELFPRNRRPQQASAPS